MTKKTIAVLLAISFLLLPAANVHSEEIAAPLTAAMAFSSSQVYPGESVVAVIVLENIGVEEIKQLRVELVLSSGLTASHEAWNIPSLPPGGLETLTFDVTAEEGAHERGEVKARITYDSESFYLAKELAVKKVPLKFEVDEPLPSSIKLGEVKEISIPFRLKNVGEEKLSNVVVSVEVDRAAFEVLGTKVYETMDKGDEHRENLKIRSLETTEAKEYSLKVKVEFTDSTGRHVLTETEKINVEEDKECIIATATFGSRLSSEVQFLRNFRDQIVYSTFAGGRFMVLFDRFYYSFSPQVAGFIADHGAARTVAKGFLYPLLAILHVSALAYNFFNFEEEFGIVVAGLTASALIGLVYLAPPLTLCFTLCRRLKKTFTIFNRWWLRGLFLLWAGSGALMAASSQFFLSEVMMASSGALVIATMSLSAWLAAGWALNGFPLRRGSR
ncbi:CFI-box-CTERM domain-containing protein [Candidatus Hecatella orcuttiae]|uniref:COG1361 S-layer family protein n=1 Tax=Candidatus Hecatella orcuttiae TaxID=1935119 RepID=UPI002867B499|nr:CFI-box-CTERM domain-containing protein [Candidatus Hecatella orcuttiae]